MHVASAVKQHLQGHGLRCWKAPDDVLPGELWPSAILRAISSCRVMVLVWSAHSMSSLGVSKELTLAMQGMLTVVPFRIENVLPVGDWKYHLANIHWMDAYAGDVADHYDSLSKYVRRILTDSPPHEVPESIHHQPSGKSQRIDNIMNAEQGVVGWDWDGTGYEKREFGIVVKKPFRSPPIIQLSLQMLDTWSERDSTSRYWLEAEDVACDKATIRIGTWNDNKLGGCKITDSYPDSNECLDEFHAARYLQLPRKGFLLPIQCLIRKRPDELPLSLRQIQFLPGCPPLSSRQLAERIMPHLPPDYCQQE